MLEEKFLLSPTISINDVTVTEGNTDTVNAAFTVSLSSTSMQSVTVQYSTMNGTAMAPSDCTSASGMLSFAPGQTSQTINISVIGDTTPEPNETFYVNLSNPMNATITRGQGTGTIMNDDNAPPPSISINDVTVTEGNSGTVNAIFTVNLSAASSQSVSVQYATQDGTATAPSDYAPTSGTLMFAPGQTSKTITVTVNGDTLVEPNETFYVNLTMPTNATLADSQGMGTITNDDTAPPTISINDMTVTEGNTGITSATFAVSLSTSSGQTVTVQYNTADGTATAPGDYAATSGTLSFAPGETAKSIPVSVSGDVSYEPNETFYVNLTNPTNATITRAQGLGTIANDDMPPTLSVNDVTVTEGNAGTVNATFTVTLAPASGLGASLQYATADGTATAPGDYAGTSGTLTFAPGETAKTVTVTINGDVTYESDETFYLNLSNPTNATIATIQDNQGVGTITNDDPLPSLSVGDVTVTEGDAGTVGALFTVSLSGATSQSVSVQYSTTGGTAVAPSDYASASGTLTFAPGESSQSVSVTVNGDTLNEADETFYLNLSMPSNATISDGQGMGTIANDDPVPTLSIADATATEGDTGMTAVNLTISLSAASGQSVSVQYATRNGTASSPADYVTTSGTVMFSPGETQKTVTVNVVGDTIDEPNEDLYVDLSNAANAMIADSVATVTITDDDAPPTLAIDDVSVTEGDSGTLTATFTVTLTGATSQTVSVQFETADGTATHPEDFTASDGTLTFNIGETQETISVVVNSDDLYEADETYFVNLSSPENATISDGQGIGTIANDDAPPQASINDVTATEGDAGTGLATFTLSLSQASGLSASVQNATADGSAIDPDDYASSSGTVTFSPGETQQTVSVTVNGDTALEPDETFYVTLSNPVGATLVGQDKHWQSQWHPNS